MIGRAAQGRPWLFREIAHFLATGETLPVPSAAELQALMLEHLQEHYELYGEYTGVRTARKHLGWYAAALAAGGSGRGRGAWRLRINAIERCEEQLDCVREFFEASPFEPPETDCMSTEKQSLQDCVRENAETYFADLEGTEPPMCTTC